MEKSAELTTAPPERQIKIYTQVYHGQDIKIVELEHGTDNQRQITTDFVRPQNWRDVLDQQLSQGVNSLWFPEYCEPDLHRRARRELGTRNIVNKLFKDTGTTDFYSHISKTAGMLGIPLFAADVANTNMYEIYSFPFSFLNLGFSADSISDFEKGPNFANVYDMRHLVLARGIMQESLRSKKSILHINAPVHSLRVDHHINDQVEWENQSSIKVSQPVDFKYVSPEIAIERMNKYRRYFGLDVSVRRYQPIFDPIVYEIDLLANRVDDYPKEHLKEKLDEYFSIKPLEKQERLLFGRIKEFSDKLAKNDPETLASAGRILTDKFGWRLDKVEKIY